MGWTHLVHGCEPPSRNECREIGADVGSTWVCDAPGCGLTWEIVGYTTDDKYDWRRLP